MNTFTIGFFGNDKTDNIFLRKKIKQAIIQLTANKEYVEFLVDRKNEFDITVSSVICELKYDICKNSHILIVQNWTEYEEISDVFSQYDHIELLRTKSIENNNFISERCYEIINRVDAVICNTGIDMLKIISYAKELNKKVIVLD